MQMASAVTGCCIRHNTRVKIYPDGSKEILVASKQIFRESGWEERGQDVSKKADTSQNQDVSVKMDTSAESEAECNSDNLARAKRRARSAVRDLALANPMTYFVTLTFDAAKVDRYDTKAVMRKVNGWLDNQVRRRGLAYILVPELHKDGAVHFHGFFNGAVSVTDSGTLIPPEGGRPRRSRSKAEHSARVADGWRPVFNLPWPYGFSTALLLQGDYHSAVGYVCKYIAKEQEKIGGRWYYHGGRLRMPDVFLADTEIDEWRAAGAATFHTETLDGVEFAIWREGVK